MLSNFVKFYVKQINFEAGTKIGGYFEASYF